MHSKATSKWTIEVFLCIVVVIAGIIIILIALTTGFVKDICPRGQEDEIFKIMNKANEIRGRPGYEIVYFEVKDCVKSITTTGLNLTVQYTTVTEGKPVEYYTGITWDFKGQTLTQGSYPFKIFEDRAELMVENL